MSEIKTFRMTPEQTAKVMGCTRGLEELLRSMGFLDGLELEALSFLGMLERDTEEALGIQVFVIDNVFEENGEQKLLGHPERQLLFDRRET